MRRLKLTSYTLHPTFYTLHPTPYTLYPTPRMLHIGGGSLQDLAVLNEYMEERKRAKGEL